MNTCPLCKTGELTYSEPHDRFVCSNGCGPWLARAAIVRANKTAIRQAERALYQLTDGKDRQAPSLTRT